MKKKGIINIFLRYITLAVLGLNNLFIFYFIFTPITIFTSYFILNLFDPITILVKSANTIIFKDFTIKIIPACVAGAAYYLLLILNLTTPMKKRKRVNSLIFLILSFFILNIIRIVAFTLLASGGFKYFDLAHKTTWYFGSTVMLIIIWFANVKIFKIKEIPVYIDLKNIYKNIKTK